MIDGAMSKVEHSTEVSESSQSDSEEQKMAVKSVATLLALLTFWVREALAGATTEAADKRGAAEIIKKIHEWTSGHIRDRVGEKDPNLRPFLDLLFATTVRTTDNPKIFVRVCRSVHLKMGDLNRTSMNDDSDADKVFDFISKANVNTVLELVLVYLDASLDATDTVIARCRQTVANRDGGLNVASQESAAYSLKV